MTADRYRNRGQQAAGLVGIHDASPLHMAYV